MKDSTNKKYWEDKGVIDLRDNEPKTPVESGYPINAITIDLTKKCNFACDYCFTNLSKGKYQITDLTEEMGKEIINWLMKEETRGKSKTVDITFWGGEPLLKWEMLKTLVLYAEKKAKEYGIKVTFGGTTNVSLLTPDKFDFLDEHNIHFLLSIDGEKEHHNKHRVYKDGSGTWDLVDKNAEAILERWPFYSARLSFSADNLDGFLDDIKYLYNKGFRTIAYSPVAESNWTEERLDKLEEVWKEIADWYIEKYKDGDPPSIKYINDACRSQFSKTGNKAPCGAGRGYIGITTDGSIYPCHRFNKFNDDRAWFNKEVCLGHIDYGILNHEFRDNFVNWDTSKHMSESCQSCSEINKSCTGGCWATNWDNAGDLGGVVEIECKTVFSNKMTGKRILKELPQIKDKYKPKKKQEGMPMIQGCQCYNVEDILFGRKTTDKRTSAKCLCNMSTYGEQPKEVNKCNCYNKEDSVVTHTDKREASCGRFEKRIESKKHISTTIKDPVQEAINYLKNQQKTVEEMTELEKRQIDEFSSLLESVEPSEDL